MALRWYRPAVGEPEELRGDDAQFKSVPLTWRPTEPGKATADYVWDLAPLDLLPEDEVLFFVEVWDNDAIHGPKRARSETRTLRFPSMAEIFDQQQQQAETREISLADLMKESQSVREEVEKAVEEFKSNPDMSWETQAGHAETARKAAGDERRAEPGIGGHAEGRRSKWTSAPCSRPRSWRRCSRSRNWCRKVITPEMRKALEKLSQSHAAAERRGDAQGAGKLQDDAGDVRTRLDQTLNMLKQLQMEQEARRTDAPPRRTGPPAGAAQSEDGAEHARERRQERRAAEEAFRRDEEDRGRNAQAGRGDEAAAAAQGPEADAGPARRRWRRSSFPSRCSRIPVR